MQPSEAAVMQTEWVAAVATRGGARLRRMAAVLWWCEEAGGNADMQELLPPKELKNSRPRGKRLPPPGTSLKSQILSRSRQKMEDGPRLELRRLRASEEHRVSREQLMRALIDSMMGIVIGF